MPEGGNNFESFDGAPGGQEATRESQEKFSEQYRQNQAAIKKIRRDEAKKHAQDDSLATIIVAFLNDPGKSAFFVLVSRLVARNIPSDLILALISLIHAPAAEKIDERLLALPPSKTLSDTGKESPFSPEVKAQIDSWTNTIARICNAEARRILDTASEADERPTTGLTQLFAVALRDYLEMKHDSEVPFENLKSFGDAFFQKVFVDLKKIAGEKLFLET